MEYLTINIQGALNVVNALINGWIGIFQAEFSSHNLI